jgi:class 3 adenylate cyclase
MMTGMDVSELIAAGLYAPDAPAAADRLALLEQLVAAGASIEEMTTAEREGRLAWLGVDRLLAEANEGLSIDEVAERVGIEVEAVERAQRALGLPAMQGPFYDETSVSGYAVAASFFGTEATLQFSRVLGSSVARVIDAAMALFVTEMAPQLLAESSSELDIAQRSADAARLLLGLPETIAALFPAYVQDAIRRLRMTDQDPTGAVRAAVGFVDLVGSTRLAQELSGRDLARAVGEFETAAYDLAVANDGRVVKFIGDEAMFVSPDAAGACAIGLGLCDMVAGHPRLTGARGAVGFGPMLAQDGDYYGSVVNLVSRLAGVARRGQLLGTRAMESAIDAAGAGYRFAPAGSHALRGFDEPVDVVAVSRR